MLTFRYFGKAPPAARQAELSNGRWRVPEETPIAFVYNGRHYAVMLATPTDIEDYAVGFSLTERVVDHLSEISSVDIHQSERGVELHLSIHSEKLERLDIRQQRRNLVGRTGCGVCGLENAEVFFERLPKVTKELLMLNKGAVKNAFQALPQFQKLNSETRAVHAAAWCGLAGEIIMVREDVGRHNALDKLLGAVAKEGFKMAHGFVLMSSRCSYEIIEKAARLNVRAVVSISAPTAFAIRKAGEANISLYARSGAEVVQVNSLSLDKV